MGGAESVVRNTDKRTSRREHRASFESAVQRFRARPFKSPSSPGVAGASPARGLRVCVRKRPFFPHEQDEGEFDAVSCFADRVVVHDARMQPDMRHMFMNHHDFAFDEVFGECVDNDAVYSSTAHRLVQNVVDGRSSTIIMYGQTGSGKTFTMSAIYQRAANDLLDRIGGDRRVTVCFVELVGDTCLDMLNGGTPCNLATAADGSVHPYPSVEVPVADGVELCALIDMACQLRATAATGVHDQSSRSHACCRLFVGPKSGRESEACLTLLDLAGTEHRIDSAEHNADRQREGAKINASLAALKDCIRARASGAKFMPFRRSWLTQLLRGCFCGVDPQPTIVIATVSPSSKDTEHSLNTLRHACIMDGQGESKTGSSAHITSGVIKKEELGEINVTEMARARSARRATGAEKAPPATWERPPPAHQAKQSNTARRSTIDRRCLKKLPQRLAKEVLEARQSLGGAQQRERFQRSAPQAAIFGDDSSLSKGVATGQPPNLKLSLAAGAPDEKPRRASLTRLTSSSSSASCSSSGEDSEAAAQDVGERSESASSPRLFAAPSGAAQKRDSEAAAQDVGERSESANSPRLFAAPSGAAQKRDRVVARGTAATSPRFVDDRKQARQASARGASPRAARSVSSPALKSSDEAQHVASKGARSSRAAHERGSSPDPAAMPVHRTQQGLEAGPHEALSIAQGRAASPVWASIAEAPDVAAGVAKSVPSPTGSPQPGTTAGVHCSNAGTAQKAPRLSRNCSSSEVPGASTAPTKGGHQFLKKGSRGGFQVQPRRQSRVKSGAPETARADSSAARRPSKVSGAFPGGPDDPPAVDRPTDVGPLPEMMEVPQPPPLLLQSLPRSETSPRVARSPPPSARSVAGTASVAIGEESPPSLCLEGDQDADVAAGVPQAQAEEQEKAWALFHDFCSYGRHAQEWRKNDLRLISTLVLPHAFGPDARVDWAHPRAALDQLERLVAERSQSCRRRNSKVLASGEVTPRLSLQGTIRAAEACSPSPRLGPKTRPLPRRRHSADFDGCEEELLGFGPGPLPARRPSTQRGESFDDDRELAFLQEQVACAENEVRQWLTELRAEMVHDAASAGYLSRR